MKKLMYAFLLISATVLGQVKEKRTVTDFTSISVSQGIEVVFTNGLNKKLIVETDSKDLFKHIKTEVKGKELRLFIENEEKRGLFKINSLKFNKLVVYIENPQLEGVKVSSGARFLLQNGLKPRKFEVLVSSSGSFKGNVTTDKLTAHISSSGSVEGAFKVANGVLLDVSSSARFYGAIHAHSLELEVSSSGKATLKGNVEKAEVKVSSSGKIEAEELQIEQLTALASSSGKGVFTVLQSLDARASSSGSIKYYGDTKIIRSKTSSSGRISNK